MHKISTHLTGFGFILYKMQQQLKCSTACTVIYVQKQYKQRTLKGRFFTAHTANMVVAEYLTNASQQM